MSIPCEIAVKCILPVVRAMTAKELVTKHHLKQVEAAKLLGISQPAISLYGSKIRGTAIDLENESDVKNLIEKLAVSLANGGFSHKDFVLMFCEICRTIRAKGLMCKLHKEFDPSIEIEKCGLCAIISDDRCVKQKS
nr:transcriptional regulator [Candidatus Freyarchaeota archaeon]